MIDEKLSYNENAAFKVLELSFNIETAIFEIEKNIKKFNELEKYIKILDEWNKNKKDEMFDSIMMNYIPSIESKVTMELIARIDSYIEYIELIQSEEDALDKYEELFNVIIQIPTKIHYYLEKELKLHNQKLECDSAIIQKNKKTSSREKMPFCYKKIDIIAA